jgi:hypothetical protein
MKRLGLIFFVSVALALLSPILWGTGHAASGQTGAQSATPPSSGSSSAQSTPPSSPSIPVDQENAKKARALVEKSIQALGGQAYLTVHDMQQTGRAYSLYHGRSTSNGVLYWRFVEYPDKERVELTPERDIAEVYFDNKGFEITYKGPHALEKKDLDDYLRRRRFSLETMLRQWINDSTVALFYDGNALAGNVEAEQVTLIDAKDEAVDLFFDLETHLPIKKSYKWRDPADKERDYEEEIFENYRNVQGVMTPYNFTRYYNGDMQSERFVNSVQYNKGLDEAMFDPNSGYNPNKVAKKKH